MSEEKPRLTRKQQVFIDEYLKCFNGAEAARRAGYSPHSARQTASDLLALPYISEQIQAGLAEIHMSAEEALKLLAEQARGDVAQLMEVTSMGFNLDMKKAQELGLTKLIKKVKQRTVTKIGKKSDDPDTETHDLEIELYDAQAALDKILRVHGKFTDRVDVTSDGKALPAITTIEIVKTYKDNE